MTLPHVTVEFGFGQSIGTAYGSVAWTDVTSYVRAGGGLSVSRGRAVVGQAPTAGTLSLWLANDDGRFTPGRAGGPYGSGVKARIPVRVRATVDTDGDGDFSDEFDPMAFGGSGATVYDVWYGFVTDWEWTPGGEVRAEVRAADILAQAAKIRCKPWLTGRHLTQAPDYYWPLTDLAGATSAAGGTPSTPAADYLPRSNVAGLSGYVVGAASYATGVESDVSPDVDAETVAAFSPGIITTSPGGLDDGVPGAGHVLRPPTFTMPGDVVGFSAWLRIRPPVGAVAPTTHWLFSLSTPSTQPMAFTVASPGPATGFTADVQDNGLTVQWPTPIVADQWTHLYVRRDNTTSTPADRYRLWLDGVEVTASFTSGGSPVSVGSGTVCDLTLIGSYGDYATFNGQAAHIAVFGSSSTTLPAVLAARGPATAADRFADLDDVTPIPGAIASWLAADATALQPVSPQPTAARTLLEVAQDIATTERGALIAGRDGRLRLQSSRARLTETVGLTLDARTDVLTFDGAFGVDDADAVDEVTVTQKPSGATYTGRRTGGVSLESSGFDVWTPSATHAQSVADGAANYPVDVPKAPNLTVSMEHMGVAGLAGDVLALELGDLIRVTNLPSSAPNTTVDLVVEAISHAVDAGGWTVTFDTSPGPLAAGAVVGTTGTLSTVATTLTVRS